MYFISYSLYPIIFKVIKATVLCGWLIIVAPNLKNVSGNEHGTVKRKKVGKIDSFPIENGVLLDGISH